MFGYLRANSAFLDDNETEIYKSYYCGICASLRKRYGLSSTLLLSYEAAFYALISSEVNGVQDSVFRGFCPANLLRKKTMRSGPGIDAAADINMILAYKSIEDNILDDSFLWRLPAAFYRRRFRSACGSLPFSDKIISRLDLFSEAEKAEDASTDSVAHCSGLLLSEILGSISPLQREPLTRLGYQLGRWIYIIDAFDDLQRDLRRKRFNPISKDFNITAKDLIPAVTAAVPLIRDSLFLTLDHIREQWESIKPQPRGGLVSNIFLLGLRKVTWDVLNKYSMEVDHDKRPL